MSEQTKSYIGRAKVSVKQEILSILRKWQDENKGKDRDVTADDFPDLCGRTIHGRSGVNKALRDLWDEGYLTRESELCHPRGGAPLKIYKIKDLKEKMPQPETGEQEVDLMGTWAGIPAFTPPVSQPGRVIRFR